MVVTSRARNSKLSCSVGRSWLQQPKHLSTCFFPFPSLPLLLGSFLFWGICEQELPNAQQPAQVLLCPTNICLWEDKQAHVWLHTSSCCLRLCWVRAQAQGDAEDEQERDAVLSSLLGFEKLLSSKVQTPLLPRNMLGLNCRAASTTPGPGRRKADGAGFLLSNVAQVPATQSGEDSRASREGICPGARERLCSPFKAVLLLWKYL